MLMCCFLFSAAADEVRVQRWQHGVHTLGTKQLDWCLINPEIIVFG